MMHFDSSNINLIRAVGYYDSEIAMLDGSTTTHGKLMGARDTMGNTRLPRAERLSTFAALNDGTMKRDTLADLAATAGRWFLWGLAAATAAMMLSMAYDLAIDLPGVTARAAQ